MFIWPEALNKLAERGTFSRVPGDPNERTAFDSGPGRVRQRYTNAPTTVAFSCKLYSWEVLVAESFRDKVIGFGSQWFKMPIAEGLEYPVRTVRALENGFQVSDDGYDNWKMDLKLEVRDPGRLDAETTLLVGLLGWPLARDAADQLDRALHTYYVDGARSAEGAIAEFSP